MRTSWNALVGRDKNTEPRGGSTSEQEFCERQNGEQTMIKKMIKDFEEQITRLGVVQAAQSQLHSSVSSTS